MMSAGMAKHRVIAICSRLQIFMDSCTYAIGEDILPQNREWTEADGRVPNDFKTVQAQKVSKFADGLHSNRNGCLAWQESKPS